MTDTVQQLTFITNELQKLADQTQELFDQNKTGELAPHLVNYQQIKDAYDALDKARKALYHVIDLQNKGVLPERFAALEIDKVRVPQIGRSFYPLVKMSASFVDRDKGYEWLRSVGMEGLITETVNSSALTAHVKDMIDNHGIEPPDDIVKVNTYSTIGSSKYNPK